MKRVLVGIGGLLALGVSALVELVFHDPSHDDLIWHALPVFDFAFGVIGCGLIVILSKWLGHRFLQRGEDYYDAGAKR